MNREKKINQPELKKFQDSLLEWYRVNKRDLPWRSKGSPYPIWVSEIMLQQTQVKTVIDYYNRFLKELPDISSLAKCPEEKLLKLWEGLGYYNRVHNMQKAARIIMKEYSGEFPTDFKTILSLPGIGRYTASAISSIAFNQPFAVLDGNVKRVLARVINFDDPVNTPASEKKLWAVAEEFLDKNHPGDYNQALMELGAEVCRPANPLCTSCPVLESCKAYELNIAKELPVKLKKGKNPTVKQAVVVIHDGSNKVLMVKRPSDGMLKGLWELPNREFQKKSDAKDIITEFYGLEEATPIKDSFIHHYSHFTLISYVWIIHSDSSFKPDGYDNWTWYDLKGYDEIAVHGAHSKILKEIKKYIL